MPIRPINPKTAEDSLTINGLGLEICQLALSVEQMHQVLEFAKLLHKSEVRDYFHYSVSYLHNLEGHEDLQGTIVTTTPITCEIAEELLLAELPKTDPSIKWVHVSNLTRITE
jgi:hypothetical protein